jgi:hypothetical protein
MRTVSFLADQRIDKLAHNRRMQSWQYSSMERRRPDMKIFQTDCFVFLYTGRVYYVLCTALSFVVL